LGGYNTWAARSAGLEVTAEPKIVGALLELLEQVTNKPRKAFEQSQGAEAQATLAMKPAAYWRLDEMAPSRAKDATGNHSDAFYEPGVVFFLAGPEGKGLCKSDDTNRCAHFAGGRLEANLPKLGESYSVSLWFWNGMPADGRETAGWI